MRGATGRSRQTGAAPLCRCTAQLAAVLGGGWLMAGQAFAFPASDVTNPSVVAPASAASAASPDQSDTSALAHQLQLLGPYASTVGPGWTFTPSLTLQEAFNDNVFQSEQDRRWDLITYVTPGLAIYGDTQNVQLRFNYTPTLEYYARNSSLDQIAQQLSAVANVTLWQDHLYLDLRAAAGVGAASGSQPGLNGGFGGFGASGPLNIGPSGLTKNNSSQTTSFAASPYFLQQFDTYGTLKLGYTISHSTASNAGGFVPLPTNTTGPSISQTTNEGLATFTSGTFLERATDTLSLDAQESTGSGIGTSSHSDTASNQVNYVLNRSITAFGSLGYENIDYGGTNALAIHDITWQVGTTLTPNPRSTLTMSYGHQQGADSLSVNGTYAATARTNFTVSYAQSLGTQLQALQNELALADINNSGTLVNSRTGAPLVNSQNLLGTQNQLYRSTTANIGMNTLFDRDTFNVNLQYAVYTAAGLGAAGSTNGVTGTASWTHALSEDLTLNVSGTYGLRWFIDPGGHNRFAALTSSLTYTISATLSTSLSYSFYDLSSTEANQSLYQDIVLLSLTKTF